ncbi:MAG: response regulator transcription factor [Actinomycetota bacterium]
MTDTDRLHRVLVVDDEPNIRELVQVALKFHGFSVTVAASGADALRQAGPGQPGSGQAGSSPPDLIVLDVMLPDLDGFEVCRRLRAEGNEVPVIFLTARDTSSDTVTGLVIGGDDYVTKPFSVEALVARIRAVLRRASRSGGAAPDEDAGLLRAGDLELDEGRWTVHRAGVPVDLSPTEFRLLACLMRHQGRVLTRAQLLEDVWGWDYAGESQIVETYVSYLRRKLDPLGEPLIRTQRGVGYSLRAPDGQQPGDHPHPGGQRPGSGG